jgi:DNA polymerase I
MRLFNTAGLDESLMRTLDEDAASNIYNGLDCCVTFEVFERLTEELDSSPDTVRRTYQSALEKQAPLLEMSMRGIRVNEESRRESIAALNKRLEFLDARFQSIMEAGFDAAPLNWRSPTQVKNLFYGMLGIKEIKKRNSKGDFAPTVDEDALNRLCLHFWAQPLAKLILALRETAKKIGFLETEIDPDHRIRTSFNIAGTNTGRLSSAMNDFGTGTNLQNVDTTLRYPFESDPGMIFVNVDLEQADGRNVGAIIHETFYDEWGPTEAGKYLDACESGDLHTTVCRMAWSELDWPDDRAGWRSVADGIAYRGLSYRDMAKKLGHGTNYYGQPATMAKHTHTPQNIIQAFQNKYFGAFPLIPEWHKWTIEEVKNNGVLTTIYGRRRHFFGRGNDASTWRKAIAYCPQSMTGHQIDMGLLNLWRHMPEAQLLMQVHDSILFQIPYRGHAKLIERAMQLLRYPIELRGGRPFYVPLEAQVGWNWGKVERDKKTKAVIGNPFGLEVWRGEETRMPPVPKRLRDYL